MCIRDSGKNGWNILIERMTAASPNNCWIISRKDGDVWDVRRSVVAVSSGLSAWDRKFCITHLLVLSLLKMTTMKSRIG